MRNISQVSLVTSYESYESRNFGVGGMAIESIEQGSKYVVNLCKQGHFLLINLQLCLFRCKICNLRLITTWWLFAHPRTPRRRKHAQAYTPDVGPGPTQDPRQCRSGARNKLEPKTAEADAFSWLASGALSGRQESNHSTTLSYLPAIYLHNPQRFCFIRLCNNNHA